MSPTHLQEALYISRSIPNGQLSWTQALSKWFSSGNTIPCWLDADDTNEGDDG